MLVFFFPETPSQIVVGLLLAFASTVIYASYRPYVQSEDDFISEIAQCQIFFILLSALLSLMSSTYDSHDEDAGDLYSEVLFGWLMVGVSLVAPVIATVMAFREWLFRLSELPAQLREASGSAPTESRNTNEIEMSPKVFPGARSKVESEVGNPIRPIV